MSNSQPPTEYFQNLEYYKKMHVEEHKLSTVKIRTSEETYNGKNAHVNIQPPKWWHEKLLNFQDKLKNIKMICMCAIIENGKYKYFPLQYNDKLTSYSSK